MIWCIFHKKYVAELRCVTCENDECRQKIPLDKELFDKLKNDNRFSFMIELTKVKRFSRKGKVIFDDGKSLFWGDSKDFKTGFKRMFKPISKYKVRYFFRPKMYEPESRITLNGIRPRNSVVVLFQSEESPYKITTWDRLLDSISYGTGFAMAVRNISQSLLRRRVRSREL